VGILTLLGSSMDQLDIVYYQECDHGMVYGTVCGMVQVTPDKTVKGSLSFKL